MANFYRGEGPAAEEYLLLYRKILMFHAVNLMARRVRPMSEMESLSATREGGSTTKPNSGVKQAGLCITSLGVECASASYGR